MTEGVHTGRQHHRHRRSSQHHRRGGKSVFHALKPSGPWEDRAIDVLLIALLAFSPLAFGVVEAWSEQVVLMLAGGLAICVALKFILNRHMQVLWSWTYVPIALFLLLALFQLAPLPTGVVRLFAPATASLRERLLGDGAAGLAIISFYPHGTWHDLRLLGALAIVYFAVFNTYRTSAQITRLLITVVIIGMLVILLALAQDVTQTENIYWTGPPGRGLASAGPFLTYNHFGQFVNLVIGAILALLFLQLLKVFENRGFETVDLILRWRDPKLRPVWWMAGLVLLAGTAVFFSQSRGAMVGMGCGLIFVTVALTLCASLPGRGWIMFPLVLAGVGLVLCLAPDYYLNRLQTLQSPESYSDRLQIVKDLTAAWRQFPVFGTGLGTHEVVYPMFDRSSILATATHAENEYAQILEETGVVGLGLCLWFLILVGAEGVRMARCARSRMRVAVVGIGAGLTAIVVQSFVDFGQHLPGVSLYTAVLCAAMAVLGQRARSHGVHEDADEGSMSNAPAIVPQSISAPEKPQYMAAPAFTDVEVLAPSRARLPGAAQWNNPLLLRVAALAVAAIATIWTAIVANNLRLAEGHWTKVTAMETGLSQNSWQDDTAAYRQLLDEAAKAAALDPGNVKYRYSLDAYRWHSISRVINAQTQTIELSAVNVASTRRIVDDLRQTRQLCPTYGPLYCLAGELETAVLQDRKAGAEDIHLAYLLSQCAPPTCLLAAKQDAWDGNWDGAREKFQRYLTLDGNFDGVARFLILDVHRASLALELAQGSVDRLNTLTDYSEVAEQAKQAKYLVLQAQCLGDNPPVASLMMLGAVATEKSDYGTAEDCYKKAIVADFGNVEARMALVRTLTRVGRIADALKEVHACLRVRPELPEALDLVKSLRSQFLKIGGEDPE